MKLLCILAVLLLTTDIKAEDKDYRQLTNLPTYYIEAEGQQSVVSKEHYIKCTLTIVDGSGITTYDSLQIRGRGNSTWRMSEKKPYRLKFASPQRLLGSGFANARDWTLLANHGDKTLIRNALTYELGRFVGLPFCPGYLFVDLYVNGQYLGNYQVSDQIEAGKQRVAVKKSSGWIIETAGKWNLERYNFTTPRGFTYNIMNPKIRTSADSIMSAVSSWIGKMEDAVFAEDFTDSIHGYRAYIDGQSLVGWYVASEITGNLDALLSIYMYRNVDQRLCFGPLWDMDFAYDRSGEYSLLREMEAFANFHDRPFQKVIQRLWSDPWFARACTNRLQHLVDAGLQEHLLHCIDSLSAHLQLSQEQNFSVWRIDQQVYSWEKPVYHDNYQAYIDDLKSFLSIHIPYLLERFKVLSAENSQ